MGLGHRHHDEYITAVSGSADTLVRSLVFQTNRRQNIAFGGGGGTPFSFQALPEFEIVGFYGRSGEYVDQLGFIARKRQPG